MKCNTTKTSLTNRKHNSIMLTFVSPEIRIPNTAAKKMEKEKRKRKKKWNTYTQVKWPSVLNFKFHL
uniref:Uncharacterized protein n=1 Tax=Rhizophora mucronata TaxID=61149 RepID=A0A2P2PBP8_RHIMU